MSGVWFSYLPSGNLCNNGKFAEIEQGIKCQKIDQLFYMTQWTFRRKGIDVFPSESSECFDKEMTLTKGYNIEQNAGVLLNLELSDWRLWLFLAKYLPLFKEWQNNTVQKLPKISIAF